MPEKAFQKCFLEAVDAAFSSLGDSAKQSIYYHLERKFMIPREDIPRRVEDFETGLEKIFGVGTRFLEVLIMKNLHENIGSEVDVLKWDESQEFKFIDYVRAAEHNYSQKKRKN